MDILLISTGGVIDRVTTGFPTENKNLTRVRSQALHTLMQVGKPDPRHDSLDYIKLGRHAARAVDDDTYLQLLCAITKNHGSTQRIIVTMNSLQAREIGTKLSLQFMCGLKCPVVLTGAEAPDPKSLADNAAHNLRAACRRDPHAPAGVYLAEGDLFHSLTPHLTDYTRAHPPRMRGKAWGRPVRALNPLA